MIWQLAGILGLHPDPFTLRQLYEMAESRQKQDWQHTSNLMALLANLLTFNRSHTFKAADFDPFAQSQTSSVIPLDTDDAMALLKKTFIPSRKTTL
ncbi:MAG TPA: hypothetical protein DCM28_19025 [Phycisphaerales bacterium]|nr:hypothetical protein [Phycisphaerales bacterium]HCD30810.1 hypothetical protein [Phycisphaerales bacterium]|tara:strand:+ start:667 stop:954 length:288 start_codon:yes stop_codon:yes gene_type:complete